MGPQIIDNQNYTAKCDVWSIGVIFYQILFGIFPWNVNVDNIDDLHNLYKAIKSEIISFPEKI